MLFSDALKPYDADTQRRLYSLFTRAVSRGELPALKLLDKMEISKRDGTARTVQDFVIPEQAGEQAKKWLADNAAKPEGRTGLTAEQAQAMTDDQLMALIARKHAPKKTRKPRTKRNTTE